MNFSDYLKSFAGLNTPEGDFERDYIQSKSKATTFQGIKRSIEKYSPCIQAQEILDKLYRKYKENKK